MSHLLWKVAQGGFWAGFFVRRNGEVHTITHFLFADDTLIMSEANQNQLRYLQCTLLLFEAASGLRINLVKLEMVPVGDVRHMEG